MKNKYSSLQIEILQQLISLVRSASGNILISDNTFEIVKHGCLALKDNNSTISNQDVFKTLTQEKYRLMCECASCKTPCGKHSDFDFNTLINSNINIVNLKFKLLNKIINSDFDKINSQNINLVYSSLYSIGEYLDPEQITDLIESYTI